MNRQYILLATQSDHSNDIYQAVLLCDAAGLLFFQTFESKDEILNSDYSNESYWVIFSCCVVYNVIQGDF